MLSWSVHANVFWKLGLNTLLGMVEACLKDPSHASLSELITKRDASCKLLYINYTSSTVAIEALSLDFATLANSSGSMMAVLPGMKSKADIEKAWSTVDRNGAWVPMDSGRGPSSHAKGLSVLRKVMFWSCTILHVDNWGKPFQCMVETGQV